MEQGTRDPIYIETTDDNLIQVEGQNDDLGVKICYSISEAIVLLSKLTKVLGSVDAETQTFKEPVKL